MKETLCVCACHTNGDSAIVAVPGWDDDISIGWFGAIASVAVIFSIVVSLTVAAVKVLS